jgi:acetyl-CoA C-acetyltransferase
MKPCDLRLGEDAIYALFAGYMEVLTDPSKIVVVASVLKTSELDSEGLGYQEIIADSMDPIYSRPVCKSVPYRLGLESVLAAMDARAFMERSGLTEEQFAQVAAKNLSNANQSGQKGSPDVNTILKSDSLSWPIRQMTKAKEIDAACTLILASEDKAKRLASKHVYIRGVGWCSGMSHLAHREQGQANETKWAAQQAYRMAGICRPEKEIDVAEVSDWYAYRELMHCEALGFCALNEIRSSIAAGVFEKNGALPVNVSGGLLGRGNAIGTSGLISVAEIALQIRGEAKGIQVPGVKVGLAHSWGGIPTATAGVAILSSW